MRLGKKVSKEPRKVAQGAEPTKPTTTLVEQDYSISADAVYEMRVRATCPSEALSTARAILAWIQEGRGYIYIPNPPDGKLQGHRLFIKANSQGKPKLIVEVGGEDWKAAGQRNTP